MSSKLKKFFKSLLDVESSQISKVIFLSIAFFLIIGAYTISKELKDAVFTTIVGHDRKYFAYAKYLSMLILIPILFLHSKLIDTVKRHELVYFYTILFGSLGLLFAFLLGNEHIGLYNTLSSPYRILGWAFYFFIESYSPLIISVFWAFANSITAPSDAKNNYTTIISASKIGGIITASLGLLLLKINIFGDTLNVQMLLGFASALLLIVPMVIYKLTKVVPRKDMHGYEAAYNVNKAINKKEEKEGWFSSITSGLVLLFKYPYVMGIFGMTFFFELVNQVIKVENIIFGKTSSSTISELAYFLIRQALIVHLVGLVIVLFGTRMIIKTLGELKALMLIPTLTGISVTFFLKYPSYTSAIVAFVVTRAVNYALTVPLRESLYIPTINEIRFKTKSWIDGLGSKFAKMASSSFNMYTDGHIASEVLTMQTVFFSITISLWVILSYALGKRYEKAVEDNEVIGAKN